MRKRCYAPSKYVKYRDGTWIECRKRIYLYWFKCLRHAEESSEHKVNWRKYQDWGGRDAVMNMKFDDWWKEHWKHCFGIDEEKGRARYMVSKRHKAAGVSYALLCYETQHRGSNWDIAIHIQKIETQKRHPVPAFTYALEELRTKTYLTTGVKKKRVYSETARMTPRKDWDGDLKSKSFDSFKIEEDFVSDEYDYEAFSNREEKRRVKGYVSRYLKQATSHLENVAQGKF